MQSDKTSLIEKTIFIPSVAVDTATALGAKTFVPTTVAPPPSSTLKITSQQTVRGDELLEIGWKRLTNKETVNASLLAFMHDLIAQSPIGNGASPLANEQLHDLERRFRDKQLTFDDDQIRDFQRMNGLILYKNIAPAGAQQCQSRAFNFQPSGTGELFLNWPAGRNSVKNYRVRDSGTAYQVCVPDDHGKWIASKTSVNHVPFSLEWYDPQLYFTQFAEPARLLRRQLEQQLAARGWSNDRLAALVADSNISLACKPSHSPQQCLLSFLQQNYSNAMRDDRETLLLLRKLFGDNPFGAAHVASMLVFMLLEQLARGDSLSPSSPFSPSLSYADSRKTPQEKQNRGQESAETEQKRKLQNANDFINNVVARIENAIISVSPIVEKSSTVEYVLRSALDAPETRHQYMSTLFQDYTREKRAETSGKEKSVSPASNRFAAAELLRWNVYFFSGWDARAVQQPLSYFVDQVDRFYQCLPTYRLVIDADSLRRLAAHNAKTLATGDIGSQASPASAAGEVACLKMPTIGEYSRLFLIAQEAAARRRSSNAAASSTAAAPKKAGIPTEWQEKETESNRESDAENPFLHVASGSERFDSNDPYAIQRVLFAIRDVILEQKESAATSVDADGWIRSVFDVLQSTFSAENRDLARAWRELARVLQHRLPAQDVVPLHDWAQWQRTILRLFNGEAVVEENIDIPAPVMTRAQFISGAPLFSASALKVESSSSRKNAEEDVKISEKK